MPIICQSLKALFTLDYSNDLDKRERWTKKRTAYRGPADGSTGTGGYGSRKCGTLAWRNYRGQSAKLTRPIWNEARSRLHVSSIGFPETRDEFAFFERDDDAYSDHS